MDKKCPRMHGQKTDRTTNDENVHGDTEKRAYK